MALSVTQVAQTGTGVSGSWANPNSVSNTSTSETPSSNWASVGIVTSGTAALEGSNFGFTIPAASVIHGVVVSCQDFTTAGPPSDLTINQMYLSLGGTTEDPAAMLTTSVATVSEGTSTFLWGLGSITPAQVNASAFGFIVGLLNQNAGTVSAFLNAFKLTIYYDSYATVTTQAASSITGTTATGNGDITNLNGEGNCTVQGIVFSTTNFAPSNGTVPSTYGTVVSSSGSFGTGTFTESLTGLTPGLTYYVAAFAENTLGYSYGAVVSFVTTAPSLRLLALLGCGS